MQQLNKYFYEVAVSRAQTRIVTEIKFYMILPRDMSNKFKIAQMRRRRDTYSLEKVIQAEGPIIFEHSLVVGGQYIVRVKAGTIWVDQIDNISESIESSF